MLRPYTAAIFDMDGLIFDTESIGYWAWAKALENYGYAMTDQIYSEFVGRDMIWREKVLKLVFGDELPFEEIKAQRINIGDTREIEEGLPLKPGILETLRLLQKNKIIMGLATGTARERTMRRIAHAGIEHFFSTVVTSADVRSGKPAPDIFLETARRLSVSPSSCIVFEDSSSGIKAASEAGMLSIMIPDLEKPSKEIVNVPYKVLPSLEGQDQLLKELFIGKNDMPIL